MNVMRLLYFAVNMTGRIQLFGGFILVKYYMPIVGDNLFATRSNHLEHAVTNCTTILYGLNLNFKEYCALLILKINDIQTN